MFGGATRTLADAPRYREMGNVIIKNDSPYRLIGEKLFRKLPRARSCGSVFAGREAWHLACDSGIRNGIPIHGQVARPASSRVTANMNRLEICLAAALDL